MNCTELLDLARHRSWAFRIFVQGRSTPPVADNSYVVGADAQGWFVGYHERGSLAMMERTADESSAVAAVLKHLEHEAPAAPDAATSLAPASGTTTIRVDGGLDEQ